jgi:hypothetical protein
MKYFISTNFLEGKQQENFPISLFRKETKPMLELIAIAIVAEDGREYYAISKDFNLKEAWNRFDIKQEWYSVDESSQSTKDVKVYWIRDNVLKLIFDELVIKEKTKYKDFTINHLEYLINKYGKTNEQIVEEVKEFCKPFITFNSTIDRKFYYTESMYIDAVNRQSLGQEVKLTNHGIPITCNPKFYIYSYTGYNWVAFKMIDLPKSFPEYCINLKQEIDNYISKTCKDAEMSTWGHEGITLDKLKQHSNYPKQTNKHNVLAKAQWVKELYYFLNTLQHEQQN